MVHINTTRVLTFILLVALSVSAYGGQEAPAAPATAGGDADVSTVTANVVTEPAPNPPKVTCMGNELTISANNSTLASVLAAVHACTGVQIDIPTGIAESRVFDQLGPGPAREVLTSMLEAMNLNYVIGSSDANPEKVDSVLLIARVGTGDAPGVGGIGDRPSSASRRAWMQTRQNRAASVPEDNSTGIVDTPVSAPVEEPAAAPVDNPAISPPPVVPEAPPARVDTPAAGPIEGKTTADQITSMQQLFEQRRKMMEQQNAPKP